MKTLIKKPFIVALLLCVSLTNWSYAQNPEAILNKVSSTLKGYENISLRFTYNLTNTKENVSQDTEGSLALKGDLYYLEMMGIMRLFDGEKIYTIAPEDEEVTISTYQSNDEKEITPSKMLTFYEEGYTYALDITQKVQGKSIQYIKLTPIDTNAEIKNILLGIDVNANHVYKLIQIDDQGTKYTITIKEFDTQKSLPSSLFSFDEEKYKQLGYYINSLD